MTLSLDLMCNLSTREVLKGKNEVENAEDSNHVFVLWADVRRVFPMMSEHWLSRTFIHALIVFTELPDKIDIGLYGAQVLSGDFGSSFNSLGLRVLTCTSKFISYKH